ncbi:hypothetical protein GCM10027168_35860 [Streptomyces capparidis]
MTRRTTAALVGLTATAVLTGAAGAGPAHATSVIGLLNSGFGNGCDTGGSADSRGSASRNPGPVTGNVIGLPTSSPTNTCGIAGLPLPPLPGPGPLAPLGKAAPLVGALT